MPTNLLAKQRQERIDNIHLEISNQADNQGVISIADVDGIIERSFWPHPATKLSYIRALMAAKYIKTLNDKDLKVLIFHPDSKRGKVQQDKELDALMARLAASDPEFAKELQAEAERISKARAHAKKNDGT